jgi:Tfp pilus assembly protein PilV
MNATSHSRRLARLRTSAFTLLEVLLAVFVFSLAVVALVEAVQQVGKSTVLQRQEAMVQDRMNSLLVEHSRLLWKQPAPTSSVSDKVLEEDGVTYTLQAAPRDGAGGYCGHLERRSQQAGGLRRHLGLPPLVPSRPVTVP